MLANHLSSAAEGGSQPGSYASLLPPVLVSSHSPQLRTLTYLTLIFHIELSPSRSPNVCLMPRLFGSTLQYL